MKNIRYQFGDQVRHTRRPEWGVGTVTRTEDATVGGKPVQRLSIRFSNGGLKKLMASHAELEPICEGQAAAIEVAAIGAAAAGGGGAGIEPWERMRQSGWLTAVAERKIDEVMVSLPEQVRDPFLSVTQRIAATLALYRFDRSGRGLVDWAVAQSGLRDPLTRFTRHELEEVFDRWARERDNHLGRLLESARYENGSLKKVLEGAPAGARDALRRFGAMR